MQIAFLKLLPAERKLYFDEAAVRRNLLPVILEKDFWVSWLLAILFRSKFQEALVFKGGTSLSKVFKVIERFSEDIDLSLSPEFLNLPPAGTSRNQADRWMTAAEAACGKAVREQIAPELERIVADILGVGKSPWFEYVEDEVTHSPVLLFHYPTTQPSGFDYLKRSVKLEFGSLTDQKPTGRHPIRPWLAETIPDGFKDWNCEVVALELERSFWEKATILHVEHHRPANKSAPARYSRHYADTASLAGLPVADAAIANVELRQRVVGWKSQYFGSGWARYDLAVPGSFKLLPTAEQEAVIRRDYEAMRDMYLQQPVAFDDIVKCLAGLESRINGKM